MYEPTPLSVLHPLPQLIVAVSYRNTRAVPLRLPTMKSVYPSLSRSRPEGVEKGAASDTSSNNDADSRKKRSPVVFAICLKSSTAPSAVPHTQAI